MLSTLIITLALLTACVPPDLPGAPRLPLPPAPPNVPGLNDLVDMLPDFDQDLLRELGLPDLSDIVGLPQLPDLPDLALGENDIAFAGPTEMRIDVGQFIRGTDIQFAGIEEGRARFLFAGLRAERVAGDSLDFDGPWSNIGGVNYNLRLRVYRIGEDYVRAAGVHRLLIENIQPLHQPALTVNRNSVKITYTGSAAVGQILKGTTFGYSGLGDQGAQISGIAAGDFPYRKSGDSLRWQGMLRADLPTAFNLRIVRYGEDSVQVAGIVSLQLPDR